ARVTVSVVDTDGVVLAIARTRDGPIFGTDVSLQKARTAAFYSGPDAAADLTSAPDTIYLDPDASPSGTTITIGDYVTAVQTFTGLPGALTDGAYAFADRSGGNLSRPYYPDGIVGTANGPFSKPIENWSVFSDGLQLDLVMNRIIEHVVHVISAGVAPDAPQNCTTLSRLPNGIQIFPGSVPIYRGNVLVGGIGVSGDGVDQDDMIAFLGLHEAGEILGTINNAPVSIRADQLTPKGVRLRYVQCPQAPYINSSEQNVCAGK
ncbi:MAG: heme-binding protein, partial [Proteobacteria bacterium]|nr:heme-binding protein [Pseudomonadota bacterium]